ncbi:MAG TPA: ATP-binding cassette domain-containing protein [Acidimicrobiales bacterium]|nr:ATP-binding cassette domain-containing protein [Acidimicrobiales bacterium]
MTGPALRMTDVHYRRDDTDILVGLGWEVGPGDRWVVLGPNGSGKTTALRLASGYDHPTSGVVEVLGARLGRTDVRRLRARLGLTSADLAKRLRPEVPVVDVVLSGLHGALETWWNDYDPADLDHALELLGRAGLRGLADHPFRTISEGERQQVQLARALVGRPELLLLDEPNAGLDLGARERLVTRLGQLATDPASPAMVLVTHHVEEIPAGMTHGLLLRDGRVMTSGPLDEALTSGSLSECFGLGLRLSHHGGRFSCQAV